MLLALDGIDVSYRMPGRAPIHALHQVGCHVERGEVIGLVGHNGAGKTTLMRVALGMIRPTSGNASVLGRNPVSQRHEVLKAVGAILDGERELRVRWKVREVLEFAGAAHGLSPTVIAARTDELLEALGVADMKERLITQLSRGMRQKVSLALALLHDPSLLILDEPILGLDASATAEFLRIVRSLSREGRGALVSSHQLNTLEPILDRIYILKDGKLLFEGTPASLVERAGKGKLKLRFDQRSPQLLSACPNLSPGEGNWLLIDNDTSQLAKVFAEAERLDLHVAGIERMVDLEAAYLSLSEEEASLEVPTP